MKTRYIKYNKEHDAYVIKDKHITQAYNLKPKGIKDKKNAPTIGILMNKMPDIYLSFKDYTQALIDAGANIKFLDYTNCIAQVQDCDGLLLVGGDFPNPQIYYDNTNSGFGFTYNARSNAYVASYLTARAKNIPILGICAGAQIIGIFNNYKMDLIKSKTNHSQSGIPYAHDIKINKNCLLRKIINKDTISINTLHKETIKPSKSSSELEIYATSTKDGVLEAWGIESANVLGIQWHPERMYKHDANKDQFAIFEWLVKKAKEL